MAVLVRFYIVIKRCHDHSNTYKRQCLIKAGLRVEKFGGKYGYIQTDVVLEKWLRLRTPHLDTPSHSANPDQPMGTIFIQTTTEV